MQICNLLFGKPYVDPVGTCSIRCAKTGCWTESTLKKRGWKPETWNTINAKAYNAQNEQVATIVG